MRAAAGGLGSGFVSFDRGACASDGTPGGIAGVNGFKGRRHGFGITSDLVGDIQALEGIFQ